MVATAIARQCSTCRVIVSLGSSIRMYGQLYCSVHCMDIGEEKNQGHDSVEFEMEEA